MSKTSSRVKNAWNKAHYARIVITLDLQDAENYAKICRKKNMTLSQIPKCAILQFLDQNK